MAIDPVTLTILNNSFVNICREMGITMMRTAFSPIFNEGLDFSCVLFDRRGEHDRPGRVLPGADRAPACSSCAGRSRSSASRPSSPATSSSTTTRTAAARTSPSTASSAPSSTRASCSASSPTSGHLAEIGGKAVGSLRRRRHRGLPGGPAHPAGQDRQARRERHGPVAADHGQPPHAAEHLGRPERADRLAARRRAPRASSCSTATGASSSTQAADELMDYSERWMRAEIERDPRRRLRVHRADGGRRRRRPSRSPSTSR